MVSNNVEPETAAGLNQSIVQQGEESLGWQNTDWLKTIEGLEQDGQFEKAAALRTKYVQGVGAQNILDDPETSAIEKVKALQKSEE